jgi:Ser/Thr protein kinase RdoA (MazF antagonist)
VAAEFGLTGPVRILPLAAGGANVFQFNTSDGMFVAKLAVDEAEAELYAAVADALNDLGIRQASPRRTREGRLVSSEGFALTEFLPGRICLPPGSEQTVAVMRHLASYQAALATVAAPAFLDERHTLWQNVARPAWLCDHLPALVQEFPPNNLDHGLIRTGLAHLEETTSAPGGQLARQVVHGDIGPDNVLMEGTTVVAVIDFTPFLAPALFGFATALYWYHVRAQGRENDPPPLDFAAVAHSVDAYAEVWPLTRAERDLVPVMILGEALRRLATTLALAATRGREPIDLEPRYKAVALLVNALDG